MDVKVYELLVKTANRLDELELFEEAESIDKYLKSMAGIKEDNDPLSKMVSLANALDCSGDEQLQKYASVLDEIMLTIGAPRGSNHEFESKADAEIAKLREKYREEGREEVYKERRKELDEQNGKEATTKAYADQVKKFNPLEMPLSTRYCPDHPGGLLIRVGDHVYQCEMDKKMYNYQTGFTTNKGNVIPGGGVEFQTKDWGNRDLGHAMFDTRQSVMSRFASDESGDSASLPSGAFWAADVGMNWTWFALLQRENDGIKILAHDRLHKERHGLKELALLDLTKERFRLIEDKKRNAIKIELNEGILQVTNPKYVFSYATFDEPNINFYLEKLAGDYFEKRRKKPADTSDANDLPQFTYGFHMLDGRKVILVKSNMKLNDKQRAEIIKQIQGPLGTVYEIVFEQDIL